MEILANETVEVKISSATPAKDAANDNTAGVKTPGVLHYSVAALKEMETARLNWEQGSLRKSNDELYAVLQQCKAFCGDLLPADAKQRSAALEKFYKERGWRYNKETPIETRVLRAVFGMENRRRVSSYSLVLREAKKQRVGISSLATWIEDQGGIQEIRLSQSKTFVSPSEKAQIMKERLASRKFFIGFAQSDLLSHVADGEYMDEDCVLLANQQPDGSFGIYTVLRSSGVMSAAYLAAHSKAEEIEAQAKKETEAANDADGQPVAA
jgi:hypothetical protein